MESILATESEAFRDFLKGLRGTIHVAFEEGTQAAWLYEIVKPVLAEVKVCIPRRNKLLAVGNKAQQPIFGQIQRGEFVKPRSAKSR